MNIPIRFNYQKILSITAATLLTAFCIFTAVYERNVYSGACSKLEEHARVMEDALWNFNVSTYSQYLSIACTLDNYRKIFVMDTNGNILMSAEGRENDPAEAFFEKLHLIRDFKLKTPVIHKGQKIGEIEAVWLCKSIYVETAVLFTLIMIFIIIMLNTRLFYAKLLLEKKVLERTEELSRLNDSLKIEAENLRKAKESLIKSESLYREYFEEDISGAYISTPEGKLIDCNEEYKKIFGFKNTDEALKTNIASFYENIEARESFLTLLKERKQIKGHKTTLKRVDGTAVNLIENASGVFDGNGDLQQIRGFILNVTEQKKLESQLQQTQKIEAIGILAGGIAHDFNNILFPIISHAEILMEDISSDNPSRESVDQIYSSAKRARDLVKQILMFSRNETYEFMPVKIQTVVKEAVKLIRSLIPSTIKIDQDIDEDCGLVKADPTQVHQIVINLSTNAYHAMGDTGDVIRISLRKTEVKKSEGSDIRPGRYACLEVTDTGTGMDQDLTRKIFDPFFTTKARGRGTGMGLSVVHGIVNNLGGGITVNSVPGRGSKFRVYFPLIEDEGEAVPAKGKPKFSNIKGAETVLLVDDEPSVIAIEKLMLTRLGYGVVSTTSSNDALEIFRSDHENIDMVITDMTMPELSGDQLAGEMVKIDPAVPIILCTGFTDSELPKRFDGPGIKGLLMKPITKNELAQKVREILDEAH